MEIWNAVWKHEKVLNTFYNSYGSYSWSLISNTIITMFCWWGFERHNDAPYSYCLKYMRFIQVRSSKMYSQLYGGNCHMKLKKALLGRVVHKHARFFWINSPPCHKNDARLVLLVGLSCIGQIFEVRTDNKLLFSCYKGLWKPVFTFNVYTRHLRVEQVRKLVRLVLLSLASHWSCLHFGIVWSVIWITRTFGLDNL